MRTIAGDVCDMRTRSSIDTGVGPSSAMMRLRSSSAGSLSCGGVSCAGTLLEFLRRQIEAAAEDRFRRGRYVGGFGDHDGALLEQAIGAFCAR